MIAEPPTRPAHPPGHVPSTTEQLDEEAVTPDEPTGIRCSLRGCVDDAAGSRCFNVPVRLAPPSSALRQWSTVPRYLPLCAAHLNALYRADVREGASQAAGEAETPESASHGDWTARASGSTASMGGVASMQPGEHVLPLDSGKLTRDSGKLTRMRSLVHALHLLRESGGHAEVTNVLEQEIVTLALELFPAP